MDVAYEVTSYQVPADLSLVHQLSSVQQRSAVRCRAVPCHTVRCGSARSCAAPCCVLCCIYSFVHATHHSTLYHTRYRHTIFFFLIPPITSGVSSIIFYGRYSYLQVSVCTALLNDKECTPSSSQLRYSSAAQRSAVRCRAVPCPALRCCAMLRCAFFRTCSTRYHAKYQVSGTSMYVCSLIIDCPLSVLFISPPRKVHSYCRSERDIASKHTAQHRAISSAQVPILGVIK